MIAFVKWVEPKTVPQWRQQLLLEHALHCECEGRGADHHRLAIVTFLRPLVYLATPLGL